MSWSWLCLCICLYRVRGNDLPSDLNTLMDLRKVIESQFVWPCLVRMGVMTPSSLRVRGELKWACSQVNLWQSWSALLGIRKHLGMLRITDEWESWLRLSGTIRQKNHLLTYPSGRSNPCLRLQRAHKALKTRHRCQEKEGPCPGLRGIGLTPGSNYCQNQSQLMGGGSDQEG